MMHRFSFSTSLKSVRFFVAFLSTFFFFSSCTLALAQTAAGSGAQLVNPLSPEFSDVSKFISGALKILVMVSLPIISLFVVYSGFMFVMAQGNSSKLAAAKTNFVYVVLGALLIMSAWIIATLIGGTVSQLTSGI